REDLTPLEEAEAYNTLMEKLNLTQTQVSERLGKSRPYIANYLRLLGLLGKVKLMLQDGSLSMEQARTLLKDKEEQKLIELAEKTVKEDLTVRQIEQLVAQINSKKPKKAKKQANPYELYIKQTENLLQEKFGTKVAVKSNAKSGKGKIEIDYLSIDDFNRIMDILKIKLD